MKPKSEQSPLIEQSASDNWPRIGVRSSKVSFSVFAIDIALFGFWEPPKLMMQLSIQLHLPMKHFLNGRTNLSHRAPVNERHCVLLRLWVNPNHNNCNEAMWFPQTHVWLIIQITTRGLAILMCRSLFWTVRGRILWPHHKRSRIVWQMSDHRIRALEEVDFVNYCVMECCCCNH